MSDIKFGSLTFALWRFYASKNDVEIDFSKANIISKNNNPLKDLVRESIEINLINGDICNDNFLFIMPNIRISLLKNNPPSLLQFFTAWLGLV